MSAVIAALERDHANFAKLLGFIESEILAIEVGKTPDYPLMQDIMRYMAEYSDRFHHPKEDLIFAKLLRRDPGVRADIEELIEEHASIGLAGLKFADFLRAPGVDSIDVRVQLGTAGLSYIRAIREHMLKEQTRLFPLATVVLSRKEWQEIDEAINTIDDPLFGTVIAKGNKRLYGLITDGQVEDLKSASADSK